MKRKMKRGFVFFVAVLSLLLGVVGLVLPILQGVLFIAIGLILLSLLSPTLRDWFEKHTRAYPSVHSKVKKVEAWLVRMVGEV